jgi:hypothetical protein
MWRNHCFISFPFAIFCLRNKEAKNIYILEKSSSENIRKFIFIIKDKQKCCGFLINLSKTLNILLVSIPSWRKKVFSPKDKSN